MLRRCHRYGCAEVIHIKLIFSEICVPLGGIAEDLSLGDVTLFLWSISDVSKYGTSVFRVKQSRLTNPRKLVTYEDKGNTKLRNQ
jgi:hypothetical protein